MITADLIRQLEAVKARAVEEGSDIVMLVFDPSNPFVHLFYAMGGCLTKQQIGTVLQELGARLEAGLDVGRVEMPKRKT